MTFQQLMLKARRRVHDYREPSGSIIDDATVDGIRWSSADLADAINEALQHLTRDLVSYGLRNNYNEAFQFTILPGTIALGVFTLVGDTNIQDIIRIETQTDKINITYIKPEKFFSDDYRNSLEATEYVFTRTKTAGDTSLLVSVLPTTLSDNARAVCSLNLGSLFAIDITDELPFNGIDDLMLDYIEANCKQKEYDLEQFMLMNKTINEKLQLLKLREQTR